MHQPPVRDDGFGPLITSLTAEHGVRRAAAVAANTVAAVKAKAEAKAAKKRGPNQPLLVFKNNDA